MLHALVPRPPEWRLDWDAVDGQVEEIRALRGCLQDPVHHGEGDVWVHTRMVVEALVADTQWRGMDDRARRIVFWAAVLHDIGKPATSREEDGRITSRGHSRRGEIMARGLLWRLGADIAEREQVAALAGHHLVPFFLLERDDPLKLAARISLRTRCDWLTLLARADATGRISPDRQRILDAVALFEEFAREAACLDAPFAFASDHSRFLYFLKDGRDPGFEAYDDTLLTAVLMSGLPAAGKDTWIADHLAGIPAVSLDRIRAELGIAHGKPQGRVIQFARERAREHLRAQSDFVWNATNLTRQTRSSLIQLFADYRARVRIVHLEAPPERLFARNSARDDAVPQAAIGRMLDRWEMPDLTECHELQRLSVGGDG
ncbi:MAG: AAA family ATPase [Hyphomicrobiales bacterium]